MKLQNISNPRRERIRIRLNDEENRLIEANARAANLGRSAYMRKCALQKRLADRDEIQKINNLSRLIDRIRDELPAAEGKLNEDLRDLFQRTMTAIDEL